MVKGVSKMKKIVGYRVFRTLTDNKGNVVHKTPVGFSKTMQGARALFVSGNCNMFGGIIEEVYAE